MDTKESDDKIPRGLPQSHTKPQTAYQNEMQSSHAKCAQNKGSQKIHTQILSPFLHLKPSFNVHNVYGIKSVYVRCFWVTFALSLCLHMSSFFFWYSDI